MKKHFGLATLLVVAIAVPLFLWLRGAITRFILPKVASQEGLYSDRLLTLEFYIMAFIFALVVGFMVYSLIAFRRRPGEGDVGAQFHGNTALEIVWTVIPLIVVMGIATLGARYYFNIFRDRPNELIVQVTGQMFSWHFAYPEYDIESTEALLPVGRPVRFDITSRDVIHSFWIVEFRLKQDAVPGMVKSLWLTPISEGDYVVRCAELCGTGHAKMLARVKVVSPEAFDAWVKEQTAAPSAAESAESTETVELDGKTVAQEAGCLACHTTDGSMSVGPTWAGLFGKEETLEDGSTVQVDEAYLYESIVDPNAKIVQGFPANLMPAYGDTLSEAEIQAIVEYIRSLAQSK